MLAAWGDSTEEDEGTGEEDAVVALMAKSDSDSDDEPLENLAQLKDKVRGLSKAKLEELLFTLMDECDAINSENCMLKDVCSELKKDIRELEHENKSKVKKPKLMCQILFYMKNSKNSRKP